MSNKNFTDFCDFFRTAESEDNGECPGADFDDDVLRLIYDNLNALEFEGCSLCSDEDVADFCDYFFITTKKDFMDSHSIDDEMSLDIVIGKMEEVTPVFYNDKKEIIMYHGDFDFDNLEWASRSQNIQHAHDTGLNKSRNSQKQKAAASKTFIKRRKLTFAQAQEVRKLYSNGKNQRQISEIYKVNRATIGLIINNKTYIIEGSIYNV